MRKITNRIGPKVPSDIDSRLVLPSQLHVSFRSKETESARDDYNSLSEDDVLAIPSVQSVLEKATVPLQEQLDVKQQKIAQMEEVCIAVYKTSSVHC